MIIGFKPQFEAKIKAGTKIHTIREDKPNRWCAGRAMHMSTGVRTKNYRCFEMQTCTGTQTISIKCVLATERSKTFRVFIDGKFFADATEYKNGEVLAPMDRLGVLAANDGFINYAEFFGWFNKDFEGKIIHWTAFRY